MTSPVSAIEDIEAALNEAPICEYPDFTNAVREVLSLARKAEALKRENAELREAIQNLMGCYDTPLSRRRFPPDDFMSEALSLARALLSKESADDRG